MGISYLRQVVDLDIKVTRLVSQFSRLTPLAKANSLRGSLEEERSMFTKVHHVTYVVESIQQMADYLEKNFGLKLERVLSRREILRA